MRLLLLLFVCLFLCARVEAFSLPGVDGKSLLDRFVPKCPADPESIRLFDDRLAIEDGLWVAVFRSVNNMPSVKKNDILDTVLISEDIVPAALVTPSVAVAKPVAVARLKASNGHCWVMDKIMCELIKENTDASCDGGSEHTEALGVAMDTLILHYLEQQQQHDRFGGAIRAKATLVSGRLLEQRGFVPVERFHPDRTTHTSSLDTCLEKFTARAVSHDHGPGVQSRSQQIRTLLEGIDREKDLQQQQQNNNNIQPEEEEFDPWAGVKKFIY